jgi:hypothetical protein
VPQLLVDPAREKRRDLWIGGDASGKQVAQIDDGVSLDVHHVMQAHHIAIGEGEIRDLIPRDR